MKEKNFKLDISKGYYNKTVCKDGITHIIDTEKEYTYYAVDLFKMYPDIETKEELKNKIKEDLENFIKALDNMKFEKEQRDTSKLHLDQISKDILEK